MATSVSWFTNLPDPPSFVNCYFCYRYSGFTFSQLHTKTALHPALPLFYFVDAHPWLFLRLQLLHTLFVSLNVLFLPFSVSVVLCLLVYRVFACQFSRNYPRQFFRGGAFLYSGFTFSHYDLPFPTRYCIPYVRSGLYQLVIRFKGFRVSAHDLDSHCNRFCPSAWTPRFQGVEFCIASAQTTSAVSAVAPS